MFKYLKSVIEKVPVPAGGVALGLAALGNLLQPYGEPIRLVFGCCSLFVLALLTAKLCFFPYLIRKDFRNSIIASVSATYCMTLMQLAGYLAPWWYLGAFTIWAAAVMAHTVLIVWFTGRFLLHFKLEEVFPSYFICFVGIIVASVTAPTFDAALIGKIIFWFGFICHIILLALVTYRYVKIPVPESAKPLFCIYAAPISLSLAGYLTVYQNPSLVFAGVLAIIAQLLLMAVVIQLPTLLRLKFYPSYAAMTFPFVIPATALSKVLATFTAAGYRIPSGLHWLMVAETVFATIMVLYVFSRYLHFLYSEALDIPSVSQRITE